VTVPPGERPRGFPACERLRTDREFREVVRKGARVSLRYRVADVTPRARVRLVVRTLSGRPRVTLRPGCAATEEELIEHVRERLARFKAPKRLVFGDLPKTGTGKIQKYVLRERLWAGHESSIGAV